MPFPLVSQVWAPNPAAKEINNSTRASFMNPPNLWTSSPGGGVTWKISSIRRLCDIGTGATDVHTRETIPQSGGIPRNRAPGRGQERILQRRDIRHVGREPQARPDQLSTDVSDCTAPPGEAVRWVYGRHACAGNPQRTLHLPRSFGGLRRAPIRRPACRYADQPDAAGGDPLAEHGELRPREKGEALPRHPVASGVALDLAGQ